MDKSWYNNSARCIPNGKWEIYIEMNEKKAKDDDNDDEYILVFMDIVVVSRKLCLFSLLCAFPFK